MPSLRDVRGKIKSIRKTQQVTKAMKMISTSRLKRTQAALQASRPYALKVEELLNDMHQRLIAEGKPLPSLLTKRENARDKILLVFTSDKGLCGSFNTSLLSEALKFYEETKSQGGQVQLFVVGRKGRDFFMRQGFPITREYVFLLKRPGFAHAEILARDLMEFYEANPNVGEVVSLFTEFKSLLKFRPTLFRLIPFECKPTSTHLDYSQRFDFLYEPEKDVLFEALLPRALKTEIYRHILESSTSEQASRMAVMDNATRNAGELIDSLTLLANKIRQSQITREIMEVVSGAEALV